MTILINLQVDHKVMSTNPQNQELLLENPNLNQIVVSESINLKTKIT